MDKIRVFKPGEPLNTIFSARHFGLCLVGDVKKAVEEFPTCEEWEQFTADMKEADVWYDVLDSPEEGKILDYVYEIMAWRVKWLSPFMKKCEK